MTKFVEFLTKYLLWTKEQRSMPILLWVWLFVPMAALWSLFDTLMYHESYDYGFVIAVALTILLTGVQDAICDVYDRKKNIQSSTPIM